MITRSFALVLTACPWLLSGAIASAQSGTALTRADTFSVVWSGRIEPESSELYTFYLTVDDGARLWIDDQCLVVRTSYQAQEELRDQIRLKAGHRVNIRIKYI